MQGREGRLGPVPRGSTSLPFAHTFGHGSCGHRESGEAEGPGWVRQARVPGLSVPPSWERGRLPLRARLGVEMRNNITLGEQYTLSSWPAHHVPPFRKDLGSRWLSAPAHVCAGVWSLLTRGHPAPGNGGRPFYLPALPHAPCSGSRAPRHHPHGGWSERPCVLAPVGEPRLYHEPRTVLQPPVPGALTLGLLFSSPWRVGKGASPTGAVGVPMALSLSLAICCLLQQACFERVCIKWTQAAIP